MIDATKNEIARLMGTARKSEYSEVNDVSSNGSGKKINTYGFYDDQIKTPSATPRVSRFWKIFGFATLMAFLVYTSNSNCEETIGEKGCRFCDQAPPKLHHDKAYTVLTSNEDNVEESVLVTPMTISYDYELQDGELLFTDSFHEFIPNLGYDYAVLAVGSIRNVYRDTRKDVSLDEVYVHHFTLFPINMLGAEVLNRDNEEDPYMRLPPGYALHITDDQNPYLRANAHLISNKNLAPIEGSQERAHKECNECFYAPGKGSDCTPEVSGTFLCCGDSPVCKDGDEQCFCPTTTSSATPHHTRGGSTSTKYTIELDVLVSRDVHKFQRVDQWNFAAPSCSINLLGDSVLEDYPPDNFCSKVNMLPTPSSKKSSEYSYYSKMPTGYVVKSTGDGALFHQVYENNQEPYLRTTSNVLAPASGKMVWIQSHLHTGGINATMYKNGVAICSNEASHGNNEDPSTNARNEQNHLVRVSSCYDQIGSGIRFEKGDVFTVESYYYAGTDDSRFSNPLAAGDHKNVMSMIFTGVVFDGTSEFLTENRTSFNEWNDFVHVADLNSRHGNH